MGWVVDHAVEAARDAAVSKLTRVLEQSSYALNQCRTVEGGTRMTMGHGHADGDRVTHDAMKAIESVERAQRSIQAAIAQLRQVDIMKWEPEEDDID